MPEAGRLKATITIEADRDTCNVDIYPASKNQFEVPVTLTYRVGLIPDLKSFILFRYDPLLRLWRPVVTSVVNLLSGEVSAKIDHFSTYRGGKAGW